MKITFINLIGLIVLAIFFVTTVITYFVTKRALKNLDGYGGTFKKGKNKGKVISKNK